MGGFPFAAFFRLWHLWHFTCQPAVEGLPFSGKSGGPKVKLFKVTFFRP